jgi:hypothetical protein
VLIYVNTSKDVGDVDHLKIFASEDAAERWFVENDQEGVAFEYQVTRMSAAHAYERVPFGATGASVQCIDGARAMFYHQVTVIAAFKAGAIFESKGDQRSVVHRCPPLEGFTVPARAARVNLFEQIHQTSKGLFVSYDTLHLGDHGC